MTVQLYSLSSYVRPLWRCLCLRFVHTHIHCSSPSEPTRLSARANCSHLAFLLVAFPPPFPPPSHLTVPSSVWCVPLHPFHRSFSFFVFDIFCIRFLPQVENSFQTQFSPLSPTLLLAISQIRLYLSTIWHLRTTLDIHIISMLL